MWSVGDQLACREEARRGSGATPAVAHEDPGSCEEPVGGEGPGDLFRSKPEERPRDFERAPSKPE
jgi:hypothetical protein